MVVTVPHVTKLVSTERYHMEVFSVPHFTQIGQEMRDLQLEIIYTPK